MKRHIQHRILSPAERAVLGLVVDTQTRAAALACLNEMKQEAAERAVRARPLPPLEPGEWEWEGQVL